MILCATYLPLILSFRILLSLAILIIAIRIGAHGGTATIPLMEAHGGKIWAQNNNDQGKYGATFSFSLPLD
jgi:hypothetical protein